MRVAISLRLLKPGVWATNSIEEDRGYCLTTLSIRPFLENEKIGVMLDHTMYIFLTEN